MADSPTPPAEPDLTDEAADRRRDIALERAISHYRVTGMNPVEATTVVRAARIFESYLKGDPEDQT